MPQEKKYQVWIQDHLMIEAGYKREEIDQMEDDEYHFKLGLVMGKKRGGTPFSGI